MWPYLLTSLLRASTDSFRFEKDSYTSGDGEGDIKCKSIIYIHIYERERSDSETALELTVNVFFVSNKDMNS